MDTQLKRRAHTHECVLVSAEVAAQILAAERMENRSAAAAAADPIDAGDGPSERVQAGMRML